MGTPLTRSTVLTSPLTPPKTRAELILQEPPLARDTQESRGMPTMPPTPFFASTPMMWRASPRHLVTGWGLRASEPIASTRMVGNSARETDIDGHHPPTTFQVLSLTSSVTSLPWTTVAICEPFQVPVVPVTLT